MCRKSTERVLSPSSPAERRLSALQPRRLACRRPGSSGRPARRHPLQLQRVETLSQPRRLRCSVFRSARVPFGATRLNYQALSLRIDLQEGMDFVAEADFRLAELPAEVDDPIVILVREVAEADVEVLDQDPHFLDGLDAVADPLEGPDVARADDAPPVGLGVRAGPLDFSMASDQDLLFRLDGQQLLFEPGEERLSFGQCKGPSFHRVFMITRGGEARQTT